MNKWKAGVVAAVSVLASVLTTLVIPQGITLFTFAKNLQTTKTIEMIKLAKDLSHEFFNEEEETFQNIRKTIESCKPLYKGYNRGGKFDHDQMNRYLGFFDDLGFYVQREALDLSMVDQFFAPYIIEAYETTEVRQYIKEFRENFNQRDAFRNFEELARNLEGIPARKDLIETFRIACPQSGARN
ncbi:MAG TPA: hypothetical protein VF427_05360 [Noviherbaspirillum sp.]